MDTRSQLGGLPNFLGNEMLFQSYKGNGDLDETAVLDLNR